MLGRTRVAHAWSLLAVGACLAQAGEAAAGPVEATLEYTADYIAPISGADDADGVFLDNLDLGVTFDMGRIAGWRDVSVYAHVLNNSGEAPNDDLGTLQGVDNIEVARQRARLYELWIEAGVGRANLRAGLYDLNSEFYANDSAGLLIAPAFGIGSELAATGPNGPSIFPSTALALRIAHPVTDDSLIRVAALNATASVLGDPDGVDTSFDDGALLIGEWSRGGGTRLALGGWAYTDKHDDIRDVDSGGAPLQRRSAGAYLTIERELQPDLTGFARLGVSDGDTTPYVGGWQAGVLLDGVFEARPESQLSFGVYQGRLSAKHRANERDAGVDVAADETGFELTYSDQLTPWLRVQPDLQLVLNPGGDRGRDHLWVAGLRFAVTPFGDAGG
ncbi:MAG TPA: carbohydrate porin [Vitreimonas sp.]|uniref:carbohydrate porin n=1 Tax=Vitreimonas sp. TaxID=3069702 RepID=UPI002D4CA742|nr:carbohydrate porin [Vitreimonas sp.]HYD88801.1 carbohydrate porin [Vitreimonas sp.]